MLLPREAHDAVREHSPPREVAPPSRDAALPGDAALSSVKAATSSVKAVDRAVLTVARGEGLVTAIGRLAAAHPRPARPAPSAVAADTGPAIEAAATVRGSATAASPRLLLLELGPEITSANLAQWLPSTLNSSMRHATLGAGDGAVGMAYPYALRQCYYQLVRAKCQAVC